MGNPEKCFYCILLGAVIMTVVLIGISMIFGYRGVPISFVETVGNEKCAETNQEFAHWTGDGGKVNIYCVPIGLDSDSYDSIEIIRNGVDR